MFYAIAITVIATIAFILSIIRLRAEMRYIDAQIATIKTTTELAISLTKNLGHLPTEGLREEVRDLPAFDFASVEDTYCFDDEDIDF